MSNRKAATAELLKYIDKLLPGSENTAVYTQRLEEMSDAQFGKYMTALESGEEILSFIYQFDSCEYHCPSDKEPDGKSLSHKEVGYHSPRQRLDELEYHDFRHGKDREGAEPEYVC